MKSGTSWVWRQLKSHPQIGLPRKRGKICKELHFVDCLGITLSDYLAKFGRVKTHKVVEFTPNYVCCPYAPAFIKTHFPDAKLLVIFRNPADRAFSHYKDHVYYRKIPGDVTLLKAFHEDYPKKHLSCYSIKSKGMYGDQLELWYKYFGKDQLKAMFYDDLLVNPLRFLQEVYAWTGVESGYVPPKYNDRVVKSYNMSYDGMKFGEGERREIFKFYDHQVEKLEDLVGRKLNWS